MDFILIRHPPIDIDDGICYGCSDVPLALPSDVSALIIRKRLSLLSAPFPNLIWSSPLIRCAKVCEKLSLLLGVPFQLDILWKEINFGSWEMCYWDDIDSTDLNLWATDLSDICVHGGESISKFVERIRKIFCSVTNIDSSQWVITHAGVIRVFTEIALRLPIGKLLERPIPFGGIVWLRRDNLDDMWKIVFWDDMNPFVVLRNY